MSGMQPEQAGLADFLHDIRRDRGPVERMPAKGPRALRHTPACTPEQAAELARLSERPPGGMVIHKFGSRSVVGRYALADGTPVVLKYYYPKNALKRMSQALCGSRCRRSWLAALALDHLGLPVPPAMWMMEKRSRGGFRLDRALLATAEAPGITLFDWVRAHETDAARLQRMAGRLGGLFAMMARHRVAHGDLKATNLIVAGDDTVRLVDLDAVALAPPPARWRAMRERDRRIFHANWNLESPAAVAFSGVFDDDV